MSSAADDQSKEPLSADQPAPEAMRGSGSKRAASAMVGFLLLVAVTFLAYLPAIRGQFIWDDDSWTTRIADLLRDASGLRTLWTKPTALQQYYPLTGTSFWIDYQLWGFRALPYHVENVLLHAFAALLFWRLLRRLEVPGAWLAGAIFALHPLMVESAGWITERKNVLSLALYLGALLAYGRFNGFWKDDMDNAKAQAAAGSPRPAWAMYALSLLLFLGALLAKTTAFSLPAVILLICWWKRGRIRWRADVVPTVPFFALTVALGLLTVWLEKNHVGAKGSGWAISLPERFLIAGRVFWFYIGKLVWPANLCFIYPRWQLDAGSLRQWIYPVTAIGTVLALWFARLRIGRGPAAAAFFFVGTLFPFLGFMNAYFMRYSFVCDHWAYLSSLGLIALGAALVARAIEHFHRPTVLKGFAAAALMVLAVLTWRHSGLYVDLETLWRTTTSRNPRSFLAYNNLGKVLMDRGQVDEAMAQYGKALEIQPDYFESQHNLGNALLGKGQVDEAIVHFQKALEIQPDDVVAHNNLGKVFMDRGRVDEAIAHFDKALAIQPEFSESQHNLGNALLRKGRLDEARVHFQKALEIQPDFFEAHNSLGIALSRKGQINEAIAHFQRAVEIQPRYAAAHNNLGRALLLTGQVDEAITQFGLALEMGANGPEDSAEMHYNLGNALVRKGQLDQAIDHYQKVLEIRPKYAEAWIQVGLALVQKGKLDEAIVDFQKALELRPDDVETHNNLANALYLGGQVDEAIAQYRKALEIRPEDFEAHYNLGSVLLQKRQVDEAIASFQKALAVQPNNSKIHERLGRILLQTGRVDEAIAHYQKVVELQPTNALAESNLGDVLLRTGQLKEALSHYQTALDLRPTNVHILNNLCWMLATCPQASVRNGPRAVQLGELAERLTEGKNRWILGTLGAAYAEAGRFSEAIAAAQRALQLATAQNDTRHADLLRAHLKLYEAGSSVRDTGMTDSTPSQDRP